MAPTGSWAIAIHGGAGVISRDTDSVPYEAVLKRSVEAGVSVLEGGLPAWWGQHDLSKPGTALAAAVAAVEVMEDSDLFNAGACSTPFVIPPCWGCL